MMSKFRREFLIAILILAGIVFPDVVYGFQDTNVRVMGFSITRKDPDNKESSVINIGASLGTTVYLVVKLPEKHVIKVAKPEDAPTMKDSSGNSMSVDGDGSGFVYGSNISDDGKTVSLPIFSKGLPAKGSTSIKIGGSLKFICGADLKTEEVDVELAKGKKLTAAGIEFTVKGIRNSFRKRNAEKVELQCQKSPASIKSILAVLADGKEVEISSSGSSESSFGRGVTYGRSYDLPGKAADVKKLKVTFFENIEELKVPLELDFGLGF